MAHLEWIPMTRSIMEEREQLLGMQALLAEAQRRIAKINLEGEQLAESLPASDPFHTELAQDKLDRENLRDALLKGPYQERLKAQLMVVLDFFKTLKTKHVEITAKIAESMRAAGQLGSAPGVITVETQYYMQELRLLDGILDKIREQFVELRTWCLDENLM